ncbi:MAG: tetratricopeptide repeat protein, partial [Anaerolineae bacterium]|nr:tetratricopeptide repeat protein [Anaerolineae bacterium]
TTGSCVLHDEMRNLVNRHAWPYVDPTGDIRRKLLRKVISGYYEVQIQNLTHQIKLNLTLPLSANNTSKVNATEWQFWRLEAECLHYHLMISEEEGRIYFDDHFLEAQRNNHLLRIQFLINEMEISGHSDIHDRVILRKAEVLRLSGQVDEAQKICETALNKEDLSLDNCISAYVTLGWIAASVDPEKAKKHFEAALYLAQEKEDKRLVGVLHNNLGRLYRLTSQLKQAVQHYQLAISYSKQAENWPVVTSATNNMAYVYHLQGNLARADAMCRVALAQRKKLGLERDIAFSYLTKAHIDQDKGNLESAERYTRLALRGFDRVGEVRGLIMAYASLANIHRYLEHYEESEAYLEQGVSLALKIRNEPLLASLFGSYGSEQRSYAISLRALGNTHNQRLIESLFLGSIEYLQKSLELAGKYGDQWLLARGQLELAMTYLYYGNHADEEIIKLIDWVWETASRLEDKLLLGYVQEVRGIMALHNRDYTRAARQLVLASRLIAQRPGREANEFFDRLSEIILDTELPQDAVIALSRTILESLGEPPESPYLQSLQSLCQQTVDLQLI